MKNTIRLLILVLLCPISATGETENEPIGYPSYAAALSSLKSDPDARVSVQGGWTIIEVASEDGMALWSFTPENHFAHPAVVRRTVLQSEGKVKIIMNAMCGAPKPQCDELIRQFEQLNSQITETRQSDS